MTGLTARETVDAVGRQLWLARQLTAALAEVSAATDDSWRLWAATATRRLDQHISIWREQLPESLLLEPDQAIAPGPGDSDAVAAPAAAVSAKARAEAVEAVLATVVHDLDDLLARAGPVSDAALARMGRFVRDDLAELARRVPTGR